MARYIATVRKTVHETHEVRIIAKSKRAAKEALRNTDLSDLDNLETSEVVGTRVLDIRDIDLPEEQDPLIDEDDLP